MPSNYERKPNTGALFKNDKKTNDKQPDYTGRFKDEDGKEWRLAGWAEYPKGGGTKYINLKISDPDDFRPKVPNAGDPAGVPVPDDIPF